MAVTIEKRKRKRGIAVTLSYLDGEGKRRRKVIGTAETREARKVIEDKAKREQKRVEHELAIGAHAPALGEESIDIAILRFLEHLAASQLKPSTISAYKDTIRVWRGFLGKTKAKRIKDVTPKLVVQFVKSQEGRANDTIAGYLSRLHRIHRHFVERGVVTSNVFQHIHVREVRPTAIRHERTFTPHELGIFLEAARGPGKSPQKDEYADFFEFQSETGLRLGEGLHVRWCDISFNGDHGAFLRVQPHDGWSPKTKRSVRNVPLTWTVEAMLKARLQAQERVDLKAAIFPNNWNNRSVGQQFNRVLKRVGLHERDERGQKPRVHSFRHYYASRLVASGSDPATVRDLLGHESIAVTNRYFNIPRSELFSAVAGAFTRTRSVHDSSGVYRFPAENKE